MTSRRTIVMPVDPGDTPAGAGTLASAVSGISQCDPSGARGRRGDSERIIDNYYGQRKGNVLVLGPAPPPYHGASVVQTAVVKWLRLQGQQIVVVDTSGSGRSGVMFHLNRVKQHLKAAIILVRKAGKPSCVYITGAGGSGLWYQLVIVMIARALHKRIVFHHHSYAYLNQKRLVMALIVHSGSKAITHIVLSNSMAEALRDIYPNATTVEVCSNAAIVRPVGEGAAPDSEVLLHVGHLSNLSSEKGLNRVLSCHAAAIEAGFSVHLHLAGPAADFAADASLQAALYGPNGHSITYHGSLQRDEIAQFFAAVDVFLFPSEYRNEAEPLVVLESIRSRVPVLATQIGCLTEALRLTQWPAVEVTTFQRAFLSILADLSTHPTAGISRAYLRSVADSQLTGFVPTSLEVILKGVEV